MLSGNWRQDDRKVVKVPEDGKIRSRSGRGGRLVKPCLDARADTAEGSAHAKGKGDRGSWAALIDSDPHLELDYRAVESKHDDN